MRELDTGTFIDEPNITFGQYLKYWLEECCKPNQTPNTYESYERNFTKQRSHASLLVKKGVQSKLISERLGHSTISITMDIYAHVLQEADKETADQFDAILTQQK